MTEPITRRLRHWPLPELGPTTWEAADLIERLEEENRQLRAALTTHSATITTWHDATTPPNNSPTNSNS